MSASGCKLSSVSMHFALQRQAWAPLGYAPHPEPSRRPMIRKVLMAAFVLILSLSAVGQGAPTTPTVVPEAGLKKVVPENYFFRGMSATTQLRNSSAVHYPDDFYVIIGLVDTSGYSTDVKAKYSGLFITEKTLKFGSSTLGPGQYGMGYTADGKFHICL